MLEAFQPPVEGLAPEFDVRDEQWLKGSFRLPDLALPVINVFRFRPVDDEYLWDKDGWEDWLISVPDQPHLKRVLAHLRNTRQTLYLSPGRVLGAARLARMCE